MSPGSIILGGPHYPPAPGLARIASSPRTWQHLVGHTVQPAIRGVNALQVTDVSSSSHEGSD